MPEQSCSVVCRSLIVIVVTTLYSTSVHVYIVINAIVLQVCNRTV